MVRCIKEEDGRVLVKVQGIRERWKNYFISFSMIAKDKSLTWKA